MTGQQTITVQEALAQGYTRYIMDDDVQVHDITDIGRNQVDLDAFDYYVCEKEEQHMTISGDEIREILNDYFYSLDTIHDDGGYIEDALKAIDEKHFNALASVVTGELSHIGFWKQTQIQLIP